jgi:hypothetical protein
MESLKVTAKTIGDLYQIWETAEPGDQRDLLRLMLREVRVDVPNGRIVSITPLAVFTPIFRKMPLLFEYEFGHFMPLWHEVSLPSVTQLPQVDAALEDSPTLPFFDRNPLLPQEDIRNTPQIAQALKMLGKRENAKVVQIVREVASAFPMDLRKWHGAQGYTMTLAEFLEQPEGYFDVMISQFALWEARQEHLEALVSKIGAGGVWYFNELLPVDFPAHWLYRVMPAAWAWVKNNTVSLHTFYNRLQAECEEVKLKRHVFSQAVSQAAAQDLLESKPRVVQDISAEALSPAIERLGQLDALISEFTIIEGWARMRVSLVNSEA